MPLYTMQSFLLPKTFCDELTQMVAQFWWGKENGKRKIHWIPLVEIMQNQNWRRFRVQRPLCFQSLLAKQGRRLIHHPMTLASQIFKARYFPDFDLLSALVKTNSSFCWRSIVEARKIIRMVARWRVSDGSQIKIWGDNWLPTKNFSKL